VKGNPIIGYNTIGPMAGPTGIETAGIFDFKLFTAFLPSGIDYELKIV
jgi:hypothetical protein